MSIRFLDGTEISKKDFFSVELAPKPDRQESVVNESHFTLFLL